MNRSRASVVLLWAVVVAVLPSSRPAWAVDAQPSPVISPIRPIPAEWTATARELSPLETGWSWTHRVAGANDRTRTALEMAAVADSPSPGLPPVFWGERIELVRDGVPSRSNAVIALSYDAAGAVVALGELVPGPAKRKLDRWNPPRVFMPAVVKADSTWTSGGTARQVVGLADVDLGRWKFPDCVVIEMGREGVPATSRIYRARGVGEVLRERRTTDGGWALATSLEEWTRPAVEPPKKEPGEVGI